MFETRALWDLGEGMRSDQQHEDEEVLRNLQEMVNAVWRHGWKQAVRRQVKALQDTHLACVLPTGVTKPECASREEAAHAPPCGPIAQYTGEGRFKASTTKTTGWGAYRRLGRACVLSCGYRPCDYERGVWEPGRVAPRKQQLQSHVQRCSSAKRQ